jgi:hypothetical protein
LRLGARVESACERQDCCSGIGEVAADILAK